MIIDLLKYKRDKHIKEQLARGRTPLYVSHATGKVTGNPNVQADNEDFGNRLARIRASIERINKLMAEIKSMGVEGSENVR